MIKKIKVKPRFYKFGKTIDKDNFAYELAKQIVNGYRECQATPYRTGNLKYNGIIARKSGNGAVIYIGGNPAPYAWFLEFSNELGNPNWGQAPNKHKGWVEKIFPYALQYGIDNLNLQITQGDIGGYVYVAEQPRKANPIREMGQPYIGKYRRVNDYTYKFNVGGALKPKTINVTKGK